MGANSGIQWTHHTFNPWWGCTKVSDGCKFCYAEALDKRFYSGDTHWGPGAVRRVTGKDNWRQPRKWNKTAKAAGERHRVFCASMADVFDDEGPVDARLRLWSLIEECDGLDWLLLTKRPENITKMVPADWLENPRFNVWYGASVEDNRVRDRISTLAKIPASVRYLSIEPQIGPIDFPPETSDIDWAIIGGESHDSPLMARELKLEWVDGDLDACKRYGVTPFVKQMGSRYAYANKLSDGHGGEPDEWPEKYRVREFPKRRIPIPSTDTDSLFTTA